MPTTTPRVLAELKPHRRRDHARAAQDARRQGLCAHRRLRRGDLQLVRRRRSAMPAPGLSRLRRQARRGAALRREPAPARGVLSRARAALRRRHRAAAAGQGALLQQHQRHRRGLRMRRRVRSERAAACVIVKHANPCGVAEGASLRRGLPQGARLRSDLGLRRHRRAQPARSTPTPRAPSPRSSPR